MPSAPRGTHFASASSPPEAVPTLRPSRHASLVVVGFVLGLAACSGSPSGPGGGGITPDPVGQVRVQTLPTGEATVSLPFSDASQEYTLVIESTFVNTTGNQIRVSGGQGAVVRALEPAAAPAGIGQDAPIRRMERELLASLPRGIRRPPSRALQPADEDEEQFFVVNTAEGIDLRDESSFDDVNAFRRFNGTNVQIYVDERDMGRISDIQINAIGSEFDTQTYGTDVNAFGEPSDIDQNDKIIILLSRTVNGMTTPDISAQGARIIGFFFGIDLEPHPTLNPFGNGREIFYAVVPNENLDIPGARVTDAEYIPLMGSVFAHEFEHMISYNEHVLVRNGAPEDTWLDEGLAHMAEGLNGYDLQNSLRSAFFLDSPYEVALVGGGDQLDERGASWLFVQYLVDRFGQGILEELVQTNQISMGNVGTATGRTFASLFHDWANMLLLDGDTIGGNEALFELPSVNLRADFASAKATLGNDRIPGTYLSPKPASTGGSPQIVNQKGMSALYIQVTATGEGNVPILITGNATAGLQVSIVRTR